MNASAQVKQFPSGYPSRPDGCIVIVQDAPKETAATFLRMHAERLPARVEVVHGVTIPHLDGRPLLNQSVRNRAARYALRKISRQPWHVEQTWGYLKAFRALKPQAVLAEFGAAAVRVREACQREEVPLIAHFHGVDASQYDYLKDHEATYPLVFRDAAAIIGVSHAMCRQLVLLGAPAERVHYSPCGVDCDLFAGASPASSPPVFLATGRFVEKKAPHLTLLAFAIVKRECPDATLKFVGAGPLLGTCRDLASALHLDEAVEFLGERSHPEIQALMRGARAFVQHSVKAADGDCEGTPVSVMEANASGLPVVSTLHGGIPDVVVDGESGYLVSERDVDAMAACMIRLAKEPVLAGRLGEMGRRRVQENHSAEKSISRLWQVIDSCRHSRHTSV